MIVYRIVKEKYANGLFASGRSGRWNIEDQWVLYTSSSRALATLELLVHRSQVQPTSDFNVLEISIQSKSIKEISLKGFTTIMEDTGSLLSVTANW